VFSEKADPTRKDSLLILIAWLSVCLLGAGQGRQSDPGIRSYWAQFGAFGLVAAVGLHAARRAGRAVEREAQRTGTGRCIQGSLANEGARRASFSTVAEGIRRIRPDSDFDI
jgi:hypothetical protein